MVDNSFHCFIDDRRICRGLNGLHKIDKKISKSADEHVGKQNGIKLRKLDLAEIRLKHERGNYDKLNV